jgi:hypothetical protein
MTRDTREIFDTCSSRIVLHCGYDEQRYPFLKPSGSLLRCIFRLLWRVWIEAAREEHLRAMIAYQTRVAKGERYHDIRNAQLLLGLHGTRLDSHTKYKMQSCQIKVGCSITSIQYQHPTKSLQAPSPCLQPRSIDTHRMQLISYRHNEVGSSEPSFLLLIPLPSIHPP